MPNEAGHRRFGSICKLPSGRYQVRYPGPDGQAYRFLRAVLMTATDDQIIARNPCRIRGGGTERPDERPVLTARQVLDLADKMPDDGFRVMVLLAAFASLRWGELAALRR